MLRFHVDGLSFGVVLDALQRLSVSTKTVSGFCAENDLTTASFFACLSQLRILGHLQLANAGALAISCSRCKSVPADIGPKIAQRL